MLKRISKQRKQRGRIPRFLDYCIHKSNHLQESRNPGIRYMYQSMGSGGRQAAAAAAAAAPA
eukprot:9446672-Heterocapsa_arctica.AAC.1